MREPREIGPSEIPEEPILAKLVGEPTPPPILVHKRRWKPSKLDISLIAVGIGSLLVLKPRRAHLASTVFFEDSQ
jgi:hypothetical protein